jgi:hypothetical protein
MILPELRQLYVLLMPATTSQSEHQFQVPNRANPQIQQLTVCFQSLAPRHAPSKLQVLYHCQSTVLFSTLPLVHDEGMIP